MALGLSLVAFGVTYLIFGLPAHRAAAAGGFSFIIIMGFAALAPLLFKKDKDKVKLDERDLLIKRKSALVAYWMVWTLFPVGAMIPWFIKGPNGMITVNYLPWMVIGGTIIIITVQSILILEEYGWGRKGEKL
jgi:hypothetical protein